MADNVGVTEGGDRTIATDEVAGVNYQRVKLADGTPDSTDYVAGDHTNGLDVDVTRVQGTVATSSTAEGATADSAVTSDTTGTVSGKLRGLIKWAYERMPASLGQKTMANSLAVAIASNQSSIPVSVDSGTITIDNATISFVPNVAGELVTITRPADSSAYAAYDVFNDSTSSPTDQKFQGGSVASPNGVLKGVTVYATAHALAGKRIRIMFKDSSLAFSDNGAYDYNYVPLFWVDMPPFHDPAGTAASTAYVYSELTGLEIPYNTDGSGYLHIAMVLLDAYTPAASQQLLPVFYVNKAG